jgi:hypothetical protein
MGKIDNTRSSLRDREERQQQDATMQAWMKLLDSKAGDWLQMRQTCVQTSIGRSVEFLDFDPELAPMETMQPSEHRTAKNFAASFDYRNGTANKAVAEHFFGEEKKTRDRRAFTICRFSWIWGTKSYLF